MEVEAPWPGTVQEIHVEVGDEVSDDDELITLESMKMLTPVPAPGGGKVTAILVAVGDYVDEGQAILTLE